MATPLRHRVRTAWVLLLPVLLLGLSTPAHGARATGGIDAAAKALRAGPVYVDPRANSLLPPSRARGLAQSIEGSDSPILVAVLPRTSQYPPRTLLRDLRAAVGIAGVYAVRLGDGFDAGADPSVMSRDVVRNLVGEVKRSHPGDPSAQLTSFTDQAEQQAHGHTPQSWRSAGPGGVSTTALIVLGVLVVLLVGSFVAVRRRGRRRQARQDAGRLEALREVVDEDITAFGEELDRLDFRPDDPAADDAMRADYGAALDSYEHAKAAMAAATRPGDVAEVTRSLENGRFSLATLAARREGRPLPERRPPCFFDPRHGPSVDDVPWAPTGGATRRVPVCAADRTRLEDGEDPAVRTVTARDGMRRPYWDAGPVYAPWAGGYFGGGLLPGLMAGTLLGSMAAAPGFGWGGGVDGGDYTGADFDPGDFSGGFGDGGPGDGGGFGGGFGDGGGFGGGDGGGFGSGQF